MLVKSILRDGLQNYRLALFKIVKVTKDRLRNSSRLMETTEVTIDLQPEKHFLMLKRGIIVTIATFEYL